MNWMLRFFLIAIIFYFSCFSLLAKSEKFKYTRKFSPEVTVIAELPVIDSNLIAVLSDPIFKGLKSNSLNFITYPIPGIINERIELNDQNVFRFNNAPYNASTYSLVDQQKEIESYLQKQSNFDFIIFNNDKSKLFSSTIPVTRVSNKQDFHNTILTLFKRNKKNGNNRKLIVLVQSIYTPKKEAIKVNIEVVRNVKALEPFAYFEKHDKTFTLYGFVDRRFEDGKSQVKDGFWGIPIKTNCEFLTKFKIEIYDDEAFTHLHKNGVRFGEVLPLPEWVGVTNEYKILKFDLDVTAENPSKPGQRAAWGDIIDHQYYFIKIVPLETNLLLDFPYPSFKADFSLCSY